MPLTTTEKSVLQAQVGTLSAQVEALVVDPPVHPLQAALDAMTAERDAAIAKCEALQSKLLQIVSIAQG